jgi:hypothetical protein
LLGSFRGAIFCELSALEIQEAAVGAGELEVEADFVAVECEVFGRGFQDSGGSHGSMGVLTKACDGGVHEIGLGLDDLKLSPVGDGHRVDQVGFDGVAGLEVGCEIIAKLDEGRWRILVQGAVGGGEAVADAVAGGIAFALGGDGSSGTGAVGAGGLDLF